MTHKEVIHFPIQWSTLRPFWFSTYLNNILESTSEVRSDSELISWGCQLIMCKSTNSTKNLSTSNIQIIWKKISLPAPLPLHSLPSPNSWLSLSSSARLSSGPTCPDMCPWTDCTLTCFLFSRKWELSFLTFHMSFLVQLGTSRGKLDQCKPIQQTNKQALAEQCQAPAKLCLLAH